jgi:hypothetical protein
MAIAAMQMRCVRLMARDSLSVCRHLDGQGVSAPNETSVRSRVNPPLFAA